MSTIDKNIENEVIKNMMKQYEKIVQIIENDCEKKGIAFIGYGYFRTSDSIQDSDSSYYATNTTIEPYDKFRAITSFKDYVDN